MLVNESLTILQSSWLFSNVLQQDLSKSFNNNGLNPCSQNPVLKPPAPAHTSTNLKN